MDKITERVCSWSINTIIWSYYSTTIVTTGIRKEGAIFTESQKKQMLSQCEIGHIGYEKTLLTYLVYFLGACYENYKLNDLTFKKEEKFIIDKVQNFFEIVKRFGKDRNYGNQPFYELCKFELDGKTYDFYKKIINALLPKLNKKDILYFTEFFLNSFEKVEPVIRVFNGARHYFYLEQTGFLNKVAGPGKSDATALLELNPGHFSKFRNSGLVEDVPLRASYIFMATTYSADIFSNYKKMAIQKKHKNNKNIIKYSKGPFMVTDNEKEASN